MKQGQKRLKNIIELAGYPGEAGETTSFIQKIIKR